MAAGFTDDPVSGWYDFLVLKLDSGGTPVWSKTYSGPTDDIAHSIQETPDYGYIVAGETGSAPWVLPYDIWLIKLDSSGTPEWQKAYGGARSEFEGRAQRTQDGGYLVTGTQSDDGPSGTKADLFVVKTKSDGSVDPSCTLVRDTAATVSDVAISVATTTRPWYDPGASSTSPPLAAESATFTRSVLCGSGTSGQSFHTVSPCRLIDTRNISSPAFLPGTRRDFLATASCGVSATARAIALNVTVVYPTAPGYLTLFPGDAPTPPVTSTINFLQGQVRANNGVVLLGADGKIGIVNGSTGSTDVVVDVVGYFE